MEELALAGGQDRIALGLRAEALLLLDRLNDVGPVYPRVELISGMSRADPLLAAVVRSGLEAIGWVRDERGLGGGRLMDGLAWSLSLDQLWESHVAANVQEQVRHEGGVLRLARRGETTTPLNWSAPSHRSLGHLAPDIVVTCRSAVWIVDAKYKSHFADIDLSGWRQVVEEIRESHRRDLHQVLAYTALFDAREITATLAYPLRHETWDALRSKGLDRVGADIYDSSRHIRVELWGMPFTATFSRWLPS